MQGQVQVVAWGGAHGMHRQGDVFSVWARQDDLYFPFPNDGQPPFANLQCALVESTEL